MICSAALHRKAIRSALMRARNLAGDLDRRRGHLPDMTPDELDAFAKGIRAICAAIETLRPDTVRAAKDAALAVGACWPAGNALLTILNHEAQQRRIDSYKR